jgi:hypothetical protein
MYENLSWHPVVHGYLLKIENKIVKNGCKKQEIDINSR